MTKNEMLAEHVRAVMKDKGLSTYDVQKASENAITAATVTKILNCEIKSSGVETLAALAKGIGISADELINIARGRPPRPSHFDIYAERFDAADLSESEWQFLETFFKQNVDHYREQRKRLDAGDFVKPSKGKK